MPSLVIFLESAGSIIHAAKELHIPFQVWFYLAHGFARQTGMLHIALCFIDDFRFNIHASY